MPVLKVYDMSSIELVSNTNEESRKVRSENKYKDYTIEDIILVRATNEYPKDRIIRPISESSFIQKDNTNFMCRKLYPDIIDDKFASYTTFYRDTIHFTENGLVSSHMYGNFENRDFIIIEPLEEQLDKADFRNLAGQDTFVYGDIHLSDKAMLLIEISKYEKLLEEHPDLENFNVVLYEGISKEELDKLDMSDFSTNFDANYERAIVERVLLDLGYIPELIGQHYIIESETSDKIVKLNEKEGQQRRIEYNCKHCYSKEYNEEKQMNDKLRIINDLILFDFLIKINELAQYNLNGFYSSTGELYSNDAATFLIETVGLEKTAQDIEIFNNIIETMSMESRFPTAKELLNGNIPNIYEEYLLGNVKTNKQNK